VKLAAYVLLGDPSWLPLAVASWYPHVDRIVASHDESGRSWAGGDLSGPIDRCLELLRQLDTDHKVEEVAGRFVAGGPDLMAAETAHRQAALDVAGQGADWVLQLDTDEVLPDARRLMAQVRTADQAGDDALELPARWLYTHVRGTWYLEMATRRLRPWEAFPGAVAVRSGTRLTHARQTDARTRRLHLGDGGPATVRGDQAVLHFSMVRSDAVMTWKATITGHARDLDWERRLGLWRQAGRHPWWACAASVARPEFGSYRPVRLPAAYGSATVEAQTTLWSP
jgi:hypothetical protein